MKLTNTRKIGLQNGAITFVIWSVVGMSFGSVWWGAIPLMMFVLLPVSSLVAWRSAQLAEQLIANRASLKTYAFDGFKSGFGATCILSLWSISSQVMAAGSPVNGASSLQVVQYIFTFVLPICILGGIVGSVHAAIFYYVNRWQLHS